MSFSLYSLIKGKRDSLCQIPFKMERTSIKRSMAIQLWEHYSLSWDQWHLKRVFYSPLYPFAGFREYGIIFSLPIINQSIK